MKRYSSREVLDILGIRAHVLRYWEQTLPIIRATRDDTRHRVFTAAQVRMLQRIRYLVIDRRISVNAAGETLIAEAGTTPASVKGGLEAVRDELIGALRAVRRSADHAKAIDRVSAADRGPVDAPGISPDEARATDNYLDIYTHGVATADPPRRVRDASSAPGIRRARIRPPVARDRSPREDRVTRVAYHHLSAYGPQARSDAEEIPAILARILRYRSEREGYDAVPPLVVAAPGGEVEAYRSVIRTPGAVVLPVPPVGFGGSVVWRAPLLGTLMAILFDDRWRTHRYIREAESLYFWAVEAPDAPFNVPAVRSDRPEAGTQSTLSMTVHPLTNRSGDRSFLLGEGWVVSHWTPEILKTLAFSGRWSIAPVLHRGADNDDTLYNGWRYDVWLRDLIDHATEWIEIPRVGAPSLWRGDAWGDQIGAVWPSLPTRNEAVI